MILRIWTIGHIVSLVFMLVFLRILIKKRNTAQKRYFTYAYVGLFAWVFFDFLFVNSSSIFISIIHLNLALFGLSCSFGYFYLTITSFVRKIDNRDRLIAVVPIALFISLILNQGSEMIITNELGNSITVLHPFYSIWLLASTLILAGTIIYLDNIIKAVSKNSLKKKLSILEYSIAFGLALGAGVILLTPFGIPSGLASVTSSLMISQSYRAFK